MSETARKLVGFIVEETGMSADEFDASTQLFSEGYIDSFTMTAMIAFIEEGFGITVPQAEVTLENFDSINNMVAFIERQQG